MWLDVVGFTNSNIVLMVLLLVTKLGWLVAKGFHRAHGVDYNETFSLIVKQPTIQVVSALTVHFDWPLH